MDVKHVSQGGPLDSGPVPLGALTERMDLLMGLAPKNIALARFFNTWKCGEKNQSTLGEMRLLASQRMYEELGTSVEKADTAANALTALESAMYAFSVKDWSKANPYLADFDACWQWLEVLAEEDESSCAMQ